MEKVSERNERKKKFKEKGYVASFTLGLSFSCLRGRSFFCAKVNSSIEAVVRRCSVKKVFLEISQNSQENTCARDSFLIKLQA